MNPLLQEDATDFERLLLGSAALDAPPEGAIARLLDRLDHGAAVVPIEEGRRARTLTRWLFVAALVAAAIFVFDRKRHREPIVRDVPTVTVPTNVPTPVSSDVRAMEMPLPASAAPTVTPSAILAVPKFAKRAEPSSRPAPALSTLMKEAQGLPSPGQSFDKGSAATALMHVPVQECKTEGGPTGAGHVTVTFATDGQAEKVGLDVGAFTAGNPTGDCIIEKFSAVHVPPFSGSSVRVGKSFVIN